MWGQDGWYFVLGAAGALASELLKLYDLRGKLTQKRYEQMMRSPLWWSVVLGMLLASGFIAWAVTSGSTVTPLQAVLSGIGARSIIRGAVEGQQSNAGARLGSADTPTAPTTLREIFQ